MGLRLLTIWDNQAKHDAQDRELRLALLASGKITPAQAFPDAFTASEEGEDDDSELGPYEYESPGEDGSNYDAVMAALAQHRTVTTREGSETSEGVTDQAFPLEPDSTEWI